MSELGLKTVSCDSCGDRSIVGSAEMAKQLRAWGKFRREAEADREFIVELFLNEITSRSCEKCGASPLSINDFAFDEDDWGDPVLCEVCKLEIPAERLEIFPNEKRCAKCKDKPDADEPEFCASCGGLMVLRQRGGAGISRYQMVCSDCGRNG